MLSLICRLSFKQKRTLFNKGAFSILVNRSLDETYLWTIKFDESVNRRLTSIGQNRIEVLGKSGGRVYS